MNPHRTHVALSLSFCDRSPNGAWKNHGVKQKCSTNLNTFHSGFRFSPPSWDLFLWHWNLRLFSTSDWAPSLTSPCWWVRGQAGYWESVLMHHYGSPGIRALLFLLLGKWDTQRWHNPRKQPSSLSSECSNPSTGTLVHDSGTETLSRVYCE